MIRESSSLGRWHLNRLERNGVNHAQIWEKDIQGRGKAIAKALRQGMPGVFEQD